MQTVNFQCGHCGNLMAVELAHLGQQVRCPTCRQVVVAPEIQLDQLFDEPTPFGDLRHDDPSMPESSENEIPTHDPTSESSVEQSVETGTASAEATLPHHEPPASNAEENGTATLPWHAPGAGEAAPAMISSATAQKVAESGKVNWFLPLVFLPLLLYAIVTTAVAVFLYSRWQPPQPSLFDQMPDVEGDHPGVRRDKKRVRLNVTKNMALQPLPDHLIVKLGETLEIGDLRVTPLSVERRKVGLFSEVRADEPEDSPYDALVLKLSLTNLSNDYAFTPLDNYFDRHWKPGDESVPWTVLQAGKEAFFGGSATWYPLRNDGRRRPRQWLVGRKNLDPEGLAPGETMETILATDGWDEPTSERLFGLNAHQGKLLWRVQLRRGLITWRGRQVSATAIIGVEFDSKVYATQVKKKAGDGEVAG